MWPTRQYPDRREGSAAAPLGRLASCPAFFSCPIHARKFMIRRRKPFMRTVASFDIFWRSMGRIHFSPCLLALPLLGSCPAFGAGEAAPPAPSSTPVTNKPGPAKVGEFFITGAKEEEQQFYMRKGMRWVPDDTKLSWAWSDRPFAIHIP